MQDFTDSPYTHRPEGPPRRKSRAIWWVLGVGAALVILGCGGGIAFVAFLGSRGPDTSVYTGNRIPSRFLRTIESLGALDEDEKILFFYSDALTDIREGFYFVSDKKVVIYMQDTDSPLTAIPFDDITEAKLHRDESFFVDSEITLYLGDGQVHSFPVSSEYGRDQEFFDAINDRKTNASEGQ